MTETVTLLCPSRRPVGLVELYTTAAQGAKGPWRMYAYVDDDEPRREEFESIVGLPFLQIVYGRRRPLSDYWNALASIAVGDIFGMMGDDIRIRTRGWDDLVRQEFAKVPDRIAFVWGRDGLHDERIGTHGFLHRRWTDAVGFTGKHFSCDWADNWPFDIANMLKRRRFVKALYTEHMHPAANKGSWDDPVHIERVARGTRDNVGQLYLDTLPEREAHAAILRAMLGTPCP